MTYVNYGSMTAIGVILPVVAVIALGLRIHLWHKHGERIEIDDMLIVPAVLLLITAGVAVIIGAQMNFLGGHSPTQTHEAFESSQIARQVKLEKFEYAFWIGDIVAIGFTKLSILFFFRRIFKGHSTRTVFDIVNWSLIGLVGSWLIALTFANIFACGTTFYAAWSTVAALTGSACVDTFALNLAGSVTNWVMDVFILVEPLIMISTLHTSMARKLSVSLIFLLATFAVAAGLVRMVVLIEINAFNFANGGTLLGLPASDDIGLISIAIFWTFMELGVGTIVACLLPTRRYFNKFGDTRMMTSLRSLLTTRSASTSKNEVIPDVPAPPRNYSEASLGLDQLKDERSLYHLELSSMHQKSPVTSPIAREDRGDRPF